MTCSNSRGKVGRHCGAPGRWSVIKEPWRRGPEIGLYVIESQPDVSIGLRWDAESGPDIVSC